MTNELMSDLRQNTRIGATDLLGNFWHYDANDPTSVANHRPGFYTAAEIKHDLFDWTAERASLTALSESGVTDADEWMAVVHSVTKKVLWVHRSNYAIHQFDNVLLTIPEILFDQGMRISSAGVFDGGAQAFVQMMPDEDCVSIGGDKLARFFTAYSSHDGMYATTYSFGHLRVGCDNTLAAYANHHGASSKIRHTPNWELRVEDARQALGIAKVIWAEAEEAIARWQNLPVMDSQFEQALAELVPFKNLEGKDLEGSGLAFATKRRNAMSTMYFTDPRVNEFTGTVWGAVQAVNTYWQWEAPFQAAKRSRESRIQQRLLTGETLVEDKRTLKALVGAGVTV